MDTIYNLLKINKNTSIKAYEKLKKLNGLWCNIQRPTTSGSIFKLEDIVDYDVLVTTREKVLILDLFREGSQGMEDYDTFIEGCYALTLWRDKFPLQTLIEVDFCNRHMSFKVDDHKNLAPNLCEQVFIKNILVPAT